MSLYTWLGGATEDRPHFDTERDLSNPRAHRYRGFEGPTFLTVNITETYDVTQIREYVLSLLDDRMTGMADEIVARVEQKMQNNINLTVEAAVAQTFTEISEEHLLSLIDEAKQELEDEENGETN